MSNQVYRNAANGGQKFVPDVSQNIYQITAPININTGGIGLTWQGIKFDKLNGTNVTGVITSGVTTLMYAPILSTRNEIRPSSISNVSSGDTYFYFLENAKYHIELTILWDEQNTASIYYLGLEVSTYNPDTNTWTIDPLIKCVNGITRANILLPVPQSICVDKYFSSNQRMRVVMQGSAALNIVPGPAGLLQTNMVISKSS